MVATVCRIGSVVVLSAGLFLCHSLSAQEIAWTFNAPIGFVDSSPAVADVDGDGSMDVVVATTAGSVIALDGEGRQIWMRGAQIPISIAPTVVDLLGDGRPEILTLNQVGQLFCIDSLAGDPIWKWNLPKNVEWGMTAITAKDIDQDNILEIVVGDNGGTIACLSNEGQVRWTYQGKHGATYSPAVGNVSGDANDEIVIAGTKLPLLCLSHTGKELWRLDRDENGSSPLLVDLDADQRYEIVVGIGSEVIAVSGTGKILWSYPMKSTIDGGLCAADADQDSKPEIYAVDLAGHLVCLTTEGQARWSASIGMRARRSPSVGDIDFGNHYVGSNEVRVEVSNPDQRALIIELEVEEAGKKPLRVESVSSSSKVEARLDYSVGGVRTTDLTLSCTVLENGKIIGRRTSDVSVIPFRKELVDLEQLLTETAQAASSLPKPREIEGSVQFLKLKLEPFRKKAVEAGTLSDVERRHLRDEITDALKQALRLHRVTLAASSLHAGGEGPICLSHANPWAPFGGMEEIVEGRLQSPELRVEAFHGEIESAALNLFNLGSEHLKARVEVEPLELTLDGEKKHVPSRDVVKLHEALEIATQTLDLSADAIPELNQANVMILPAWDARQLWLNIDTSKLAVGTWTTRVRIRTLEVKSREFSAPLQIVVWKSALPAKQKLSLCHWGYVPGSLLGDQPQAALEDQVANGTNVFVAGYVPTATYDEQGNLGEIDYRAHDDYVRRYGPHGTILFQHTGIVSGPGGTDSPAYRKAHVTMLRKWVKHLAEMGIGYDRFALYPVDEPGLHDGLVEIYLQYAKLAREADPKIQMYTDPVARITIDDLKSMLPYVDIWCPNRVGFLLDSGKEKLDLMRSSGKTLWNYECAGNAKHQSPLGYYRGQAWLAWHHGLTGIGFWSYCTSSADPWYYPQATLDYLLIYQGKGVVPSKRWEAIRDGIEDYSMLATLRDAVASGSISADSMPAAQKLLGEEASTIARFCGLDEEGTEPGKSGLPGVRKTADQRWHQLQDVRRQIATVLAQKKND